MQETSAALIEQLVYLDNFLSNSDTPNLEADAPQNLDLAAFADASFIFADEDKPNYHDSDDENGPEESSSGYANPRQHNLDVSEFSGSNAPLEPSSNFFQLGSPNLPDLSSRHPGDADRNANMLHSHDFGDSGSKNGFDSRAGDGHQLHSLLNDKIETAKRNKFNSYTTHSAAQQASHNEPVEGSSSQSMYHSNNQEHQNAHSQQVPTFNMPDLSRLPKFPVPPGAKTSLKQAGLSQNQIDLLSALIVQHQTSLSEDIQQRRQQEKISSAKQDHVFGESLIPDSKNHTSPISATPANEPDRFNRTTLGHLTRNNSLTLLESPASNFGSEHSSGSTSSTQPLFRDNDSRKAEESPRTDPDKRRRNTEASARFRVKKKLREKEMESRIVDLTKSIERFESKISLLESENKLLKSLIVERGNRNSDEELRMLKTKAMQPNT